MNIFQVCFKTKTFRGDGSRGEACNSYEYIKALSPEHAIDVSQKHIRKYDKHAHDFYVHKDCGEGNWFEKLHCLKINYLAL